MRPIVAALVLGALAALAFSVMLAACQPGPRWAGKDLHVVDGYLVDVEQPCAEPPPFTRCAAPIRYAIASLGPADRRQVVRASIGRRPGVLRDGQLVLSLTGALATDDAVILDFTDGTRRLIGVFCGPRYDAAGHILFTPENCRTSAPPLPREGQPPPG